MTLICTGLSYHHTALEIRERLFVSELDMLPCLQELHTIMNEVVIVSTCNRLEIYGTTEDPAAAYEAIIAMFAARFAVSAHELRAHFQVMQDDMALAHLLRVAAGLDSMILGESQILGQVAEAMQLAQSARTTGPILNRLFEIAVHAGKRARSETAIGEHSISVSHAAARLVQDLMPAQNASILLVGAGEMADLAAQALHDRGLRGFRIVNRTLEHAQQLAQRVNAEAVDWSSLWSLMQTVDIVISCTGAPHTVIFATDVQQVMAQRAQRPLMFVDIAVPRDVEAAVGQLPGVQCYDIDDLQRVVDEGLAQRRQSVPQVEAILAFEALRFQEWLNSRQMAPVITDLRRKLQAVADDELRTTLNRLNHLDTRDQALVEQLVHRIVNKVLHDPTVTLRERAANGDTEAYAAVVRDLFALVNADEVHFER